MKDFYERNDQLINSDVNKTFDELLVMTDDEFKSWVREMRNEVRRIWDELGCPPRVGINEPDIIKQFNKLEGFPIHELITKDELTGDNDVLANNKRVGTAVNQWFPTMMKTRILYGKDPSKAKSIYDWFVEEDLFERQVNFARRNFKRDSFYHFAPVVRRGNLEENLILADTGKEWIEKFEERIRPHNEYSYWIDPCDSIEVYTGYSSSMKESKFLSITRTEAIEMNKEGIIPDHALANLYTKDDEICRIRLFKKGQKIFPVGFKSFRVTYCQYAVNFPPVIAKFLYQTYTEDIKNQDVINIWDPSAGWAGRLLGAISVKDDRQIHYIGTDPNTDHNLPNGKTKYDSVAEFYNTKTNRANDALFEPVLNTHKIFQCGSEVVKDNPEFQKYKGELDFVFTSPPYFAKEIYSEDEAQSCHKFSTYADWRDNFLYPTLKTAVEYLKEDRYMAWNIADAVFDNVTLPMEKDSIDYLESLGMKYIKTWKMKLAQMPGGNRVGEDGKPTAKNFCKVNGKWFKYEPIFIFKKMK